MKKTIILVLCFIFIFMIGMVFGIIGFNHTDNRISDKYIENIDVKYKDNKEYYIITGDTDKDFDYQEIDLIEYRESEYDIQDILKLYNTTSIYTYDEYYNFCKKWNLNRKYDDFDSNYMIISYASLGSCIVDARIASIDVKDDNITIYMWDNFDGVTADVAGYFIAIPVSRKVKKYNVNVAYTESEYENILKYGSTYNPYDIDIKKPIIYVYPEKEMNVSIKLKNPSLLSVSYPKYNNGWDVIASVNGNLYDKKTNRNYYGLYYEANNHITTIKDDGFVVEGKDTIDFLEEKLGILGLNEKETNEFIIYWLPILEKNKYNYIRFETIDEINNYMPLIINPKPDTLIRVVMDYKPLNNKIDVNEQKLEKQVRKGYTIVEWGGSEIK